MKKKILFVIHQLNIGGVQKSFVSAINNIDRERFDITVYVRKNRSDLLSDINTDGINVIVNDDCRNYYRTPYAVFLTLISFVFGFIPALKKRTENSLKKHIVSKQAKYEYRKYFKGKSFDIAVSYIQGYTAEFTSEYVSADKKYVFWHGSTDENHALHEKIFPSFDKIIGVSENIENVLKGLYPAFAEKITHLNNYVDADIIRALAIKESIPHPEMPVLCSCGRFTPVKGYDIAVETARLLKEKGVSFRWYFVGDGPERKKLESLIEKYGLGEEIIITGMLKNPYPHIAACDVYVQPSREEAVGLSVIEAFILCRPVVSTRTVGGTTLIKEGVNGVLADISSESLAEEIIRLLADENLKKSIVASLTDSDYSQEKADYKKSLHGLFLQEDEV